MHPLLVSFIVAAVWWLYMGLTHGVGLKKLAEANPVLGSPEPKKAGIIFIVIFVSSILLVYL